MVDVRTLRLATGKLHGQPPVGTFGPCNVVRCWCQRLLQAPNRLNPAAGIDDEGGLVEGLHLAGDCPFPLRDREGCQLVIGGKLVDIIVAVQALDRADIFLADAAALAGRRCCRVCRVVEIGAASVFCQPRTRFLQVGEGVRIDRAIGNECCQVPWPARTQGSEERNGRIDIRRCCLVQHDCRPAVRYHWQ